MKFACASKVSIDKNRSTLLITKVHILVAFIIEAVNKYEAEGKALEISRKCYPITLGFYDHFVQVTNGEVVVDIDKVIESNPNDF